MWSTGLPRQDCWHFTNLTEKILRLNVKNSMPDAPSERHSESNLSATPKNKSKCYRIKFSFRNYNSIFSRARQKWKCQMAMEKKVRVRSRDDATLENRRSSRSLTARTLPLPTTGLPYNLQCKRRQHVW
jgi:hypothetical protein